MQWMENANMVNGQNKILVLEYIKLPLGLPFWPKIFIK